MENQKNQIQKSSSPQLSVKLQETLNTSKTIISGQANIAVIEMGLSIQKTFLQPNMKSVFKGENGAIGYGVVNVLVSRFIDSFGFSTKLSPTQIETLTVDTLDNFGYESLEDIILFFKMARTGKFGSTKRGVDSNLIYGEWFPSYLMLKAEIREQNYLKEKNALNNRVITLEDVKKTYDKLAAKKLLEKVQAYVDKITTGIDRPSLEKLIKEWNTDPIKKEYIALLKTKRLSIKGDYKFDE